MKTRSCTSGFNEMSASPTILETPTKPHPSAVATEDAEALRRGMITTEISPLLARLLTVLFIAPLFGVPLFQAACELSQGKPIQALAIFKFREIPSKQALDEYESN